MPRARIITAWDPTPPPRLPDDHPDRFALITEKLCDYRNSVERELTFRCIEHCKRIGTKCSCELLEEAEDERKRLSVLIWQIAPEAAEQTSNSTANLGLEHRVRLAIASVDRFLHSVNRRAKDGEYLDFFSGPFRQESDERLEELFQVLDLLRSSGGKANPPPARSMIDLFVPTKLQQEILQCLESVALRSRALAKKIGVNQPTLYKRGGILELMARGLVQHHRRTGYYNTDTPPPEIKRALRSQSKRRMNTPRGAKV